MHSFSYDVGKDEAGEQPMTTVRRSNRVNTQSECKSDIYRPSTLKRKRIKIEKDTKRVEIKEEVDDEKREYLPEVADYVKEDMDILIIGSNPGRMSSRKGQHFSHPSNHFYKALDQSDLTPTRIPPSQDYTLLHQPFPYLSIGLTNLVARPTRMAQDLNKTEEALGSEILINLIRTYRPKLGLMIGIGVSRSFQRSLAQFNLKKNRGIKKEEEEKEEEEAEDSIIIRVSTSIPLISDTNLGLGVGLMDIGVRHLHGYTLLYSMPSTSGRVTTHKLKEKTACMKWARILTSQLNTIPDTDSHNVRIRLL